MSSLFQDFMNDKDVLQNCSMSPFSPSKNKRRMTESQKGKVSHKVHISYVLEM